MLYETSAENGSKKLAGVGGNGISGHNGPNIAGMRAGITGGDHAENNSEGDAVEFGPDNIVVKQNVQTVETGIHQKCSSSVRERDAFDMVGIVHEMPMILKPGTHGIGDHHKGREHDQTEGVDDGGGGNMDIANGTGQLYTNRFIQESVKKKRSHANRQGSGINGHASVNTRGVIQSGGQKQTYQKSYSQSQENTPGCIAYGDGIGIGNYSTV